MLPLDHTLEVTGVRMSLLLLIPMVDLVDLEDSELGMLPLKKLVRLTLR